LAQRLAVDLVGAGLWQAVKKPDLAWIFVRQQGLLGMVPQLQGEGVIRLDAGGRNHPGPDAHPFVGKLHGLDAGLVNLWMLV
jgi:hypothetical protein